MSNTRTVSGTVCDRKTEGYPRRDFTFTFESVDDLLIKIDALIENLEFRKVDVYLHDDSIFSKEEQRRLEVEWVMFGEIF